MLTDIGSHAWILYREENRRVRAVVQRVREASVSVAGDVVAACGPGLVVLLGIAVGDEQEDGNRLARKIARLRVFENADGRFDLSLRDVAGAALVVSQFTLIADTKGQKGTRPDFSKGQHGPRSRSRSTSDSARRYASRGCRSRRACSVRGCRSRS